MLESRPQAVIQAVIQRTVLAETTIPTGGGDVTLRTKWFGTVVPELDVRPFGTGRAHSPTGPWTELEQYDTLDEALRGHSRWLAQLGQLGQPAAEA